MKMEDVDVGIFVKFPNDSETKYMVVEKIPITGTLIIRKFGNGDIGSAKASEVEPW